MELIKVAICDSYGAYGLSDKAINLYIDRKGYHNNHNTAWDCNCSCGKCLTGYRGNRIARDDPLLIQIIKELGSEANTEYCRLKIVVAVKDFYSISSYDGLETLQSADDLSGYIKKLDVDRMSNEELGKKVKYYLDLSRRASILWDRLYIIENEEHDASLVEKQNTD
jgi:hypothetical protein